jgi:excisionase family DNA binding protein|tara:strand:- start:740 stop:916 length:177 start_codon:yes stop_codon:yes gene_type:complete
MDKFLTPEEVAENLRVHYQTVYNWLRDGKLPAVKVGSQWRISESSFKSFIGVTNNEKT